MDLLAEVLAIADVTGAVGARIEAGTDWGWWWSSQTPRASLHAVTAGTAWVQLPGGEQIQLLPGDVILLPRGSDHAIGSDPAATARTSATGFDPWRWTDRGTIAIGRAPAHTRVLCADYDHSATVSTQILDLLPEVVHIRAGGDEDGLLQDTVRLLGRELAGERAAGAVVIDRLVDVLLIQVLRAWLAGDEARPAASWLGALDDPVVGEAVARLHADPGRTWSTEVLAHELAVSRATLARRFIASTGETPGAYLTRWRMDLAAKRLRDSDDSLEAIADSVGYSSAYAFSRAFSRARSVSPARFRAQARAARQHPVTA